MIFVIANAESHSFVLLLRSSTQDLVNVNVLILIILQLVLLLSIMIRLHVNAYVDYPLQTALLPSL